MYKVIFEDKKLVRIKYESVVFTIEKETGILIELKNTQKEPVDVFIPDVFPSGHQIRYLKSNKVDKVHTYEVMAKGNFNRITIADHIFIGCCAFQFVKVKEVVWNDCTCIPQDCFTASTLEKIKNIENVTTIMYAAFCKSKIKGIEWPEYCDKIPDSCFQNCKELRKLSAPNVKEIEEAAFAYSSITAFDWPAGCSAIPKSCFWYSNLTKIKNIQNVQSVGEYAFGQCCLREITWPSSCREIPAYCFSGTMISEISNINNVETIHRYAFENTQISKLDLSETNISYLNPLSLRGLPSKCKVIPPYYMDDKAFASAINRSVNAIYE